MRFSTPYLLAKIPTAFSVFLWHLCFSIVLLLRSNTYAYAQNADIDLLRNINLYRNKNLDAPMEAITNSAYVVSAIVPVTELITGYITQNKALTAKGWQCVAGLGINTVLTFGLKYTVNRQRPYTTYTYLQPYRHNKDASFPSGHTSFAFNTATSLSIAFPKWYVIVPGYAWATTIAYSRMHLGMHYPTDLLGGAVVGAASAWLSCKGTEWLQKKQQHNHPTPL
jgi:undecaprenyl-diphosphatase